MYSILSAYLSGVEFSTVAGKLKIISFHQKEFHLSITLLQISSANLISVHVKLSGEYSNCKFHLKSLKYCLIKSTQFSAKLIISSCDLLNTTSL
jgi:phosphorylcholine metabolism protein LicD